MRTFEVFLNGERLCTAGVGDDGVLTAIVSSVRRRGKEREDLRLEVGGLIQPLAENLRWQNRRLRAGDDVCIRIAESELASKPSRRERSDPALAAKAQEKHLEGAATRLG